MTELKIRVDTTELDSALEKATRLSSPLEKIHEQIQSLGVGKEKRSPHRHGSWSHRTIRVVHTMKGGEGK